jgi:Zn-dependent protease
VIQLFRVRGIPVRIDVGWLLVFGLMSWILASGYFPHVLPALSPAQYWLHGVLASLLLFASVFLHELSHALVALEHGIPVGGITLHVFGGVSQLDAEPPTPRAEALIAAVGPLTSFGIAGLCFTAERAVAGLPSLQAVTGYLAAVNLVIGVFNLLPGFPLDGGRLLRAALWYWTGALPRATLVASRIGSAFAFLMMALGLARMLGGELMGGAWLVLIGLFLHQAARSAWALMRVRTQLEPLQVADVMSPALEQETAGPLGPDDRVRPHDSAWLAFLKIARNPARQVAVADGDAVVGVVSQRSLQQVLLLDEARSGAQRRAA